MIIYLNKKQKLDCKRDMKNILSIITYKLINYNKLYFGLPNIWSPRNPLLRPEVLQFSNAIVVVVFGMYGFGRSRNHCMITYYITIRYIGQVSDLETVKRKIYLISYNGKQL